MVRRIASGLVATLLVCSVSSSAWAQATRTWVSGVGDDANPCSRTAPCKTFAGAISKTAATGVIDVLDPGGYGAVTITKAITVEAVGNTASVLVSGTNGIIVNVAVTDQVVLRGLSFVGIGTGLSAVKFVQGKSLVVDGCTISGFTLPIDFEPAATTTATLLVRNSSISGNNGTNSGGLIVGTGGSATIASSRFFDNTFGVHATGTGRISIWDSVFSGHSAQGIWASDTSEINVDHGLVADNVIGVQGDATVRLSDVMLGHNTTGIAGTKVVSFGNNRIGAGNGDNGAAPGTLPQQ